MSGLQLRKLVSTQEDLQQQLATQLTSCRKEADAAAQQHKASQQQLQDSLAEAQAAVTALAEELQVRRPGLQQCSSSIYGQKVKVYPIVECSMILYIVTVINTIMRPHKLDAVRFPVHISPTQACCCTVMLLHGDAGNCLCCRNARHHWGLLRTVSCTEIKLWMC